MDKYDLYASLDLDRTASSEELRSELTARVGAMAAEGKDMSDPTYHETDTASRILGDPALRERYDARLASDDPISVDDLLILADTGRFPKTVTPLPVRAALMLAAILSLVGLAGTAYYGFLTFNVRMQSAGASDLLAGITGATNYVLFTQLVLVLAALAGVEAHIAYALARRRLAWPPALVVTFVLFFLFVPMAGMATFNLLLCSLILVLLAAQVILLAMPTVRFWVAR